jgi:hypothetical protein
VQRLVTRARARPVSWCIKHICDFKILYYYYLLSFIFLLWQLSRPPGMLLGWRKAPVITTMSESKALYHQRSLWKQAGRRLDVTNQQPRQRKFVIMVTFATYGEVARVGEGTRDHSNEWIKGRILLVDTLTRLGWPISPRLHPGERREPSFSPFAPKAGLLWRSVDGRSPRLQPATAGSSRHHPRRL